MPKHTKYNQFMSNTKFIMFPYFPKTRNDHATLGHSDIINGSIFHTLITSYI